MLLNKSGNLMDRMLILATIIYYVMIDAVRLLVGREGSHVGGMILIGQLFLLIFFYLIQTKGHIFIKLSSYHLYFVLLIIYCFANCFWASYPDVAVARSQQLAEIAILMMIIYTVFDQRINAVDELLTVIMLGGFFLITLYILAYGWTYIIFSLRNAERISSDIINANTLGMAAAYSCVLFVHRLMEKKIRIWWIPFVVLSFITLLVSQSRKGALIFVLGIIGDFVLKNYKDKNKLKVLVRIVLSVAAIVILITQWDRFDVIFGILDRMKILINSFLGGGETDRSIVARNAFLIIGLKLFREHPIGGIGIDCAQFFTTGLYGYNYHLHNNYIELLADGGIVGFGLYYWLYFYMLIKMIKYRDFNDPEFNICFVIFIIRIIMDYGFYAYKDQSTYFFFLLFYLYYRKMMKRMKNNIEMQW